jgi:AcrR family transcriptional regulator
MRQRSDVVRNRQAILQAATALYDKADDLTATTMDDVAAAAGVGKGTVFRRFGDRAGLLRAVFDERIAALTEAIESGPPPLGPTTPPRERVAAVLIAIVDFKTDNRRLTRALEDIELRPRAPRFYQTANYQWTHGLLRDLLVEVVGAKSSGFCAHALLSLTRIDLIEHLIDTEAYTPPQLQRLILDHVAQVTDPGNLDRPGGHPGRA